MDSLTHFMRSHDEDNPTCGRLYFPGVKLTVIEHEVDCEECLRLLHGTLVPIPDLAGQLTREKRNRVTLVNAWSSIAIQYSHHTSQCERLQGGRCNCGLSDAITKAQEFERDFA